MPGLVPLLVLLALFACGAAVWHGGEKPNQWLALAAVALLCIALLVQVWR